jgi:hypothetical protein
MSYKIIDQYFYKDLYELIVDYLVGDKKYWKEQAKTLGNIKILEATNQCFQDNNKLFYVSPYNKIFVFFNKSLNNSELGYTQYTMYKKYCFIEYNVKKTNKLNELKELNRQSLMSVYNHNRSFKQNVWDLGMYELCMSDFL